MKVFAPLVCCFFSLSSFACMIDISYINQKVATEVSENLHVSAEDLKTQVLLSSFDFYPEVRTSSCPNATVFYHSFKANLNSRTCSILTKYKLSYTREEINPFSVLDLECE